MKTISLRFSNNFAPRCGTIESHQAVIDKWGYVWYGKLGAKVSALVGKEILENTSPKILLIHSGSTDRYWAYVTDIQWNTPSVEQIPEYYRHISDKFNTWFRVIRFEEAPKDILSKCYVASSGAVLSNASKRSMNPYFIIRYEE